ncbi:hypothetical protein H0I76_07125 [Limibaculum sp. M0105]|uniref:Phytanoyl-CoA dioxygenase n=1 Tax=Thermohalobaculum xanthum TaxID=2753746 RepID=A0A8J7SDP0_9RHOB|nr:hypothetical protein [Thermohalobaculum xanthum]MBK0398956.1 hypothetical protein [Thermohalobaculum xanthum]
MTDAALAAAFFSRGWAGFPHDPEIAAWASAARPVAGDLLADPDLRARWLRCGGTWFAGVNVLPNDDRGAVPDAGVPPVSGAVVDFVRDRLGLAAFAWDRAQISICLPGYPAAPSEDESAAAFRFRRDRDAAHVDGLARDAARRRTIGEVHGFILGIPLTQAPRDAAPLVVWEGSHEIIRSALKARLAGVPVERWALEDITDAYTAARGQVFETCRRVAVHALPGECYLVHRLALHGVAPWGDAEPSGLRAIAYFRPDPYPGRDPAWWLDDK